MMAEKTTWGATYPDCTAITRTDFVESIFAEQVQEGPVGLQETTLVFINGHLLQNPLVHQSSTFDAVPKPVLDLDLPHQDGLDAPLQSVQDGGDLVGLKKTSRETSWVIH